MSSTYIRLPLQGAATTPFLQETSFAVNKSSNSKLWVYRTLGTIYDFSTPFTFIIPFKAKWSTGLGSGWLFDLLSMFYVYISPGFLNIRAFDATGNSTTSTAVTLVDDNWMWIGVTYDGAGGYQFIVDDQLKTNSNTRVLVNNINTIKLGERSGFNVALDMSMGNVLILNKVISSGELTSYYNSGVSKNAYDVFPASDIIHYYKADDIQQTTVQDRGGVEATIRGATTVNGLLTTIDVPS